VLAFDFDDIPLSARVLGWLVHKVMMRISGRLIVRREVDAAGQIYHVPFSLLEYVEVNPCRVDRTAPACMCVRPASLQHPSNDLCQPGYLGSPEPALRDPRRAEANSRRRTRTLVTGDSVAVTDDTRQIEDIGRDVAHQRRALLLVRTYPGTCPHALGIDQQQVRIGATIWDAEAETLKLAGQVPRIRDHLLLHLPERLCSRQLERDGHTGNGVDVGPALLAREDRRVHFTCQ